jgi:hypothetical protein
MRAFGWMSGQEAADANGVHRRNHVRLVDLRAVALCQERQQLCRDQGPILRHPKADLERTDSRRSLGNRHATVWTREYGQIFAQDLATDPQRMGLAS